MAGGARDYPRSVRAFPAQVVLQRMWKGDLSWRSSFCLGRSEVALVVLVVLVALLQSRGAVLTTWPSFFEKTMEAFYPSNITPTLALYPRPPRKILGRF